MTASTQPSSATADPNCLFCKIAAGQIPSYKVYEDDVVFAFLDINPIVRGHLLIITKAHYPSLLQTPPDVLAMVNQRLPKLAQTMLKVTQTKACHILTNSGPEAGQSIPTSTTTSSRIHNDGYRLNWPSQKLAENDAHPLLAAALHELAQQKANSQK